MTSNNSFPDFQRVREWATVFWTFTFDFFLLTTTARVYRKHKNSNKTSDLRYQNGCILQYWKFDDFGRTWTSSTATNWFPRYVCNTHKQHRNSVLEPQKASMSGLCNVLGYSEQYITLVFLKSTDKSKTARHRAMSFALGMVKLVLDVWWVTFSNVLGRGRIRVWCKAQRSLGSRLSAGNRIAGRFNLYFWKSLGPQYVYDCLWLANSIHPLFLTSPDSSFMRFGRIPRSQCTCTRVRIPHSYRCINMNYKSHRICNPRAFLRVWSFALPY